MIPERITTIEAVSMAKSIMEKAELQRAEFTQRQADAERKGCDCCDPTSPSHDPVSRDWLCDPPHSYLRGFKAMKRPCLVLLWKKRATHWVCLYRMLIPINDCRGKLIRVPLGETKVTPGDSTWNPLRGPDEGMALNTPFRDGAHIRWDARKLLMPAYVIYGKVCDVVRDCTTHEEVR